jgi:hypothetical protein
MSASNTLEAQLANHYFLNAAIPNVGDVAGLPASAVAGNLYVNLYDGDPGEAGGGAAILTYTGYVEFVATRDGNASTGWALSGSRMSNRGLLNFGKRTDNGAAQEAKYWGIDRASGSTDPDYSGPVATADSIVVTCDDIAGDKLVAPQHNLADDDQVIFIAAPGDNLPTGITEGTRYYVHSKTDDDFEIGTGLAGAGPVDITAVGSGRVCRVVVQSVTQDQTPKLAASGLVVLFN